MRETLEGIACGDAHPVFQRNRLFSSQYDVLVFGREID
jgi:hypothetical protein